MSTSLASNLLAFANNSYHGRVIIAGLNETSTAYYLLYAITGRSEGSRNRVFKEEDGRVFTDWADPDKAQGDPELVIYDAMCEGPNETFAVSNGRQTEDILTHFDKHGIGPYEGLSQWEYEPDAPNYTSRIAALLSIDRGNPLEMAVVRKSEYGDFSVRDFFVFDRLPPGIGYCIMTYTGDGNPLPAFCGEPVALPLRGNALEILERYREALSGPHFVALAMKEVLASSGTSTTKIINRYGL